MTGGGSGGHITPILAVARELKKIRPDIRIVYVGQRDDGLSDVPAEDPNVDEIIHVRAGKFRRYHGEGLRQLLDLYTMWLNIRDAFWILIGLWQSFWLLRRLKPGIIFTRGSYVSVPVTLAGALQGIPYVTHDSDAIPGLTNRLIARWASLHAVALPEELYPYPIDKTETVGIPISGDYVPVTAPLQREYRSELGLSGYDKMLFVTGGGNGARRLNEIIVDNASHLLGRYPGLVIVHATGRALEAETIEAYAQTLDDTAKKRVIVRGFIKDLYRYSGAADIIIARGSATNLAEFAVQGKACISIPAPQLIWTVKNTEALVKAGAIASLTEDQAEQELRLASVVNELLDDDTKRTGLASRLAAYAKPDAAHKIATRLLELARPEASTERKNEQNG